MKEKQARVAILLAAYNGEKYLKEQIESIINQSYQLWDLYIREDGSSDRTKEIISDYARQYPKRIFPVTNKSQKKGAAGNFFALMEAAYEKKYPYYMASDQDDVWLENKVEVSVKEAQRIERSHPGLPVLVHSDLKVVDEQLNVLGQSFIKYRALNPECTELKRLLIQNNVTGCTMCWNHLLMEKATLGGAIKLEGIVLHDWWFAVCASAFGCISFISEPLILYRQHSSNVVGATKVKSIGFVLNRLFGNNHVKKTLYESIIQGKTFLEYYKEELSKEDKKTLEAFAGMENKNKLGRIKTVISKGFWKQGWIQCVGELLFI